MSGLWKNLLAVALGLALLLAAEGLLLLAGVTPLAKDDPFVGFAGSVPLFLPDGSGRYALNPAKERHFNPQSFVMPKPAGTFRMVAFGGSTTYGQPYLDHTSFIAWLERLLQRYAAPRPYEHINAGGISYASYRVVRLMAELAQYAPDLYVVYSGHNEFLEARTFAAIKDEPPLLRSTRQLLHHSRLYTLLQRGLARLRKGAAPSAKTTLGSEVYERLEEVGGPELYHRDPAFREGVIRQYRHSLERMVALCREQRIPLILCTLPSNLSGLSPFKSEHKDGITAAELRSWNDAFARAEQALAAGDAQGTLARLAEAERIDPEYALLHFRKGQALQALGRSAEAYAAFVRAKQEDIIPLRALEEFNRIVREVAATEQVPLADVEGMFRRVSPDGIPGNNLFVDHVHPSIEGQQMVAWVVLDTAVKHGLVPLAPSLWQQNVAAARNQLRTALAEIPPRYRAMGLWGVGRVYYWGGKYDEAYVALQEAWSSVKDVPDIPLKLGLIELARGRAAMALDYLKIANGMDPASALCLLSLAKAYHQLKEDRQALAIIERLQQQGYASAAVHAVRGQALIGLGDEAQALAPLGKAVELAPEVAGYRLELAVALARAGQPEAADRHFRTYLQLIRHPDPERELTLWRERSRGRQGGGRP